ncbi:MAG: bis(5'-nucleosyl)-tetraphosphatase [Patescibacteria group bacterium]
MEKSAGAIIFRNQGDQVLFLLLHYPNRSSRVKREHWDFSKGHIEKGENEVDAAKREIKEETGLADIKILDGFQEIIKYYFTVGKKTIFKTVIFYLAETKTKDIKISDEHVGFKWLPYKEALKQLTFSKPKNILKKASGFLLDSKGVKIIK